MKRLAPHCQITVTSGLVCHVVGYRHLRISYWRPADKRDLSGKNATDGAVAPGGHVTGRHDVPSCVLSDRRGHGPLRVGCVMPQMRLAAGTCSGMAARSLDPPYIVTFR